MVLFDHKHRLQVENQRWVLPCANCHPDRPVPLRYTTETNLYHFVLVHRHIDGPQCVTDFFDFDGVVGHRHIPLSDIIELLTELQLLGRGTCGENLLQNFPSLLRRLRILNEAQHLIVYTGCKTVQDSTYFLLPH